MRKFRSRLTIAMVILVCVTSFLSVLFAILTVNGRFLERAEMRHVMFGLAAGDVLLLILLVTIIATGFVLVMRSSIQPLVELDRAIRKVTAGDYDVQVKVRDKASEISELQRNFNLMVEQLKNNAYLHKDFSSNISHEFKTPLSIIKGYADLLEEGNLTEEERKMYAGFISMESTRLTELTSNLLKLSRLDHDAIHGKRSSFCLDEQIRQTVLSMESKWTGKDLHIDLELQEAFFTGEEELLNLVWFNLLDNAVKFTEKGGTIQITLRRHEKHIAVAVSDDGIGMSFETMKHIYDRFYRGNTEKRYEGAGLGLSLVQRIVHLHGGRISVDSVQGEGSCFTVTLPAKDIR